MNVFIQLLFTLISYPHLSFSYIVYIHKNVMVLRRWLLVAQNIEGSYLVQWSYYTSARPLDEKKSPTPTCNNCSILYRYGKESIQEKPV